VADDGSALERTSEHWREIFQNFFVPIASVQEWGKTQGWDFSPGRGWSVPPVPEPTPISDAPAPAQQHAADSPKPAETGKERMPRAHKRGRRPTVRVRARDRLLELMRNRSITPEQLASEKKETLPKVWGLSGSPNTVWAAKDEALLEFEAEQAGRLNF
jgi:hypothetical protein